MSLTAGLERVRLDHVSKSYSGGTSFAVHDVSLAVWPGEIVVLLGSSGSGKSTILKMVNGLVPTTLGVVEVRGQSVLNLPTVELRRSIGYVSQGIALFPHMRVWENVSMPLRVRGVNALKRREAARRILDIMAMSPELADRYPAQLSGGQQQRVGVARALVAGQDILLMDEPFGALDAVTRESLQQELLSLIKRLNVAAIFVTHDLFEALTLADRVGVMHQGLLEQIGSRAELMERPATPFVRDLFEKPLRQLDAVRANRK